MKNSLNVIEVRINFAYGNLSHNCWQFRNSNRNFYWSFVNWQATFTCTHEKARKKKFLVDDLFDGDMQTTLTHCSNSNRNRTKHRQNKNEKLFPTTSTHTHMSTHATIHNSCHRHTYTYIDPIPQTQYFQDFLSWDVLLFTMTIETAHCESTERTGNRNMMRNNFFVCTINNIS